jgi:DNA-binding SARP family transcriptional activator
MFAALIVNVHLYKGEMEQARCAIEKFQAMLDPSRPHSYSLYHYEMTWYHLLLGQSDQAVSHAASAVRIATESGYLFTEINSRIIEAHALLASGDVQKSQAALDYTGKLIAPTGSITMRFHWLLIAAHHAFEQGDDKTGLDLLREAMTTGCTTGFRTVNMWWHPGVMSRLCARALEASIEVGYTREMIRNHRLLPPDSAASLESWPWPIKLHTLGSFELLIDGIPVDFSGKRKLSELLKALVSFGGTAVRKDQILDLLWPEADGDDAQSSFKMTILRLRKLLPDDAIRFEEHTYTLNRRLVWADLWDFDQRYNAAVTLWDKAREAECVAIEAITMTDKALALYQGHFLPGDTSHAWTVLQRERLRTKLQRLIVITGTHLEEHGKWGSAADVYRQGLDADPLHEEFYQRLMNCHHEQGQRTEALVVYERCRAELSVHLKIHPSPKTEMLHAKLRN